MKKIMLILAKKGLEEAWRDLKDIYEDTGHPFTRVEGDLYSSPEKERSNPADQAVYRGRIDKARLEKGLKPIDWESVDAASAY